MTKKFEFWLRPKRKEKVRQEREGSPDLAGGWQKRTLDGCAGQLLIGRWCAEWRHVLAAETERLGHHENHSENDRSAAAVEWICYD